MQAISTFSQHSTADDVLAGVDLTGKTFIVTGATSGIGLETARALAWSGGDVILAVRNELAGHNAARLINKEEHAGRARVSFLDLSDFTSIQEFAERESKKPLSALIANAAVFACPFERTAQGIEMQLGVNHVGHALLSRLMTPALSQSAAARVVFVSSVAHHWAPFDFEDPNFDRTPYDKFKAYGRSKTANALYAKAFHKNAKSVTAYSLMPGNIRTGLGKHLSTDDLASLGVLDNTHNLFVKTPAQGAATSVWAATAPSLTEVGGLYLEDCQLAPASEGEQSTHGVAAHASDPKAADRIWEWTESAIRAAL